MPLSPDIYEQFNDLMQRAQQRGLVSPDLIDAQDRINQRMQKEYPGYFHLKSMRGTLDPADEERLMRTGLTPGNAVEYTTAHIRSLKRRGIDVPQERANAIYDLYKQGSGRTDNLSNRDFFAEQSEAIRQQREESLGGRFENAALAGLQNLGSTAYSVAGTVAPEWANEKQQEYATVLNPNMESRSGMAGNLGAEAAKLVAFGQAGNLGVAGIYGAQGFGGTRQEVDRLRQQGREISLADEMKAAVGVGLTEAASGYLKQKIFGHVANTAQALNGASLGTIIRESVRLMGGALSEGSEEAITQLITNKIKQGTINPQQAITEGVWESFLTGAILSPIGAGGHMGQQQGQQAEPLANPDFQVPGLEQEAPVTEAAIPKAPLQIGSDIVPPSRQLTDQSSPRFLAGEQGIVDTRVPERPAGVREPMPVTEAVDRDELRRTAGETLRARGEEETQRGDELQAKADTLKGRQQALEERLAAQGIKTESKPATTKIGDLTLKNELTPDEVDDYSALLSPREDITDADEIDADISVQRGNREAALKRPGDTFEMVELPVAAFEPRNLKEGTAKGEKYKGRDPKTAPPIVAGIPADKDTGKLITTDGDTRLKAALLRGDKTIRAYVPKGDLAELQERLAKKKAPAPKAPPKHTPTRVSTPETKRLDAQISELTQQGKESRRKGLNAQAKRQELAVDRLVKERDAQVRKAIGEEAEGIVAREQSKDTFAKLEDAEFRRKNREEAEVQIEKQGKQDVKDTEADESFKRAQERETDEVTAESTRRRIDLRMKRQEATQKREKTEAKEEAKLDKELSQRKEAQPDVKAPVSKRPEAVAVAQEDARDYMRAFKPDGQTDVPDEDYVEVNTIRARQIAKAYEDMAHNPDDPQTKASYTALKKETKDQYDHLAGRGITFEFVTENPYTNSQEMVADVRDNRRLKVFKTSAGFGKDNVNTDHPLLEKMPGTDITYNDAFRAIHDYYGHAKNGFGFGPRGEENAWRAHSQMFSQVARPAMTTETRGQNSWVNFGPKGVENRANPATTTYAEQKAGLLPSTYWQDAGMPPVGTGKVEQAASPEGSTREAAKKADGIVRDLPPVEGTESGPVKRWANRTVEDVVTPIMSRILDINPAVATKLQKFQYDADTDRETLSNQARKAADRFVPELKKDKAKYAQWSWFWMNGKHREARALLNNISPDAAKAMDEWKLLLRNLEDQAVQAGVIGQGLPDYGPRLVKDYKSMKAEFGDEGPFKDAIDIAQAAAGRPLSEQEKVEIVNRVLLGTGPQKPGKVGTGHARKRSIDQIKPENMKFYADPVHAMFEYIEKMTYAVRKAELLGRNAATVEEIENTVGSLVKKEAGNMDPEAQRELSDLIQARFLGDMRPTGRITRTIKAVAYAINLGQVRSFFSQIMDVATTAADHNVPDTIRSIFEHFTRQTNLKPNEKKIVMENLGLHEHAEEYRDISKFNKAVDAALTWSGLRYGDRFGKETRANTALRAFTRAAKNPESDAYKRMAGEYQARVDKVMGEGTWESLVADLRAGRRTHNVGFLIRMDLDRRQPTSLWEMPKAYATEPRLRIAYTMKSFLVKQIDRMRRDIFRQLATPGQRASGLRNLSRYTALYGALALGVNWIKDEFLKQLTRMFFGDTPKEDEGVEFTERLADAGWSMFGLSQFTADKFSKDPVGALWEWMAPPGRVLKDAATDINHVFSGRFKESKWRDKPVGVKTIRDIPVVGELLYWNTPIGEGWYQTDRDRLKRFNEKMLTLKEEAEDAILTGNEDLALDLVQVYNDRQQDRWQAAMDEWSDSKDEKAKKPERPNRLNVNRLRNRLTEEGELSDE